MFVQIIRLEGTSQIRLYDIHVYDIYNNEIQISKSAKAIQSSDLTENVGNPLNQETITYNAQNPLQGQLTKTSGFENGWWEIDLGELIEIGMVNISRTNVGKIICMNSDRKVLFSEIRSGFFTFENSPDYVVNLPHTYYLSDSIVSDCMNETVYEYQSCKSSDEVSCPPKYVPKLKSPIHDLIANDNDNLKKWAILSQKTCGTLVDPKIGTKYKLKNPTSWSDCNNGQKIRLWQECQHPEYCPDKMPFKETQMCQNGELSWEPWSTCVNIDAFKGIKSRKSTCIPPQNGGNPCPDIPNIETQDCTNAQLSQWSEWSKCEKLADGTMGISKSRNCIDGTNGGSTCEEQTQPLILTKPCSDAKMTEWSEWSKCIDALQQRTRTCIPPVNGGKECDPNADLLVTQGCSDGYLTPWSEFGQCNGAFRTRKRTCIPPTGHGQPCPQDATLIDTEPCSNIWSECSVAFYQTNENDKIRFCFPYWSYTYLVLLFIVLLTIFRFV